METKVEKRTADQIINQEIGIFLSELQVLDPSIDPDISNKRIEAVYHLMAVVEDFLKSLPLKIRIDFVLQSTIERYQLTRQQKTKFSFLDANGNNIVWDFSKEGISDKIRIESVAQQITKRYQLAQKNKTSFSFLDANGDNITWDFSKEGISDNTSVDFAVQQTIKRYQFAQQNKTMFSFLNAKNKNVTFDFSKEGILTNAKHTTRHTMRLAVTQEACHFIVTSAGAELITDIQNAFKALDLADDKKIAMWEKFKEIIQYIDLAIIGSAKQIKNINSLSENPQTTLSYFINIRDKNMPKMQWNDDLKNAFNRFCQPLKEQLLKQLPEAQETHGGQPTRTDTNDTDDGEEDDKFESHPLYKKVIEAEQAKEQESAEFDDTRTRSASTPPARKLPSEINKFHHTHRLFAPTKATSSQPPATNQLPPTQPPAKEVPPAPSQQQTTLPTSVPSNRPLPPSRANRGHLQSVASASSTQQSSASDTSYSSNDTRSRTVSLPAPPPHPSASQDKVKNLAGTLAKTIKQKQHPVFKATEPSASQPIPLTTPGGFVNPELAKNVPPPLPVAPPH